MLKLHITDSYLLHVHFYSFSAGQNVSVNSEECRPIDNIQVDLSRLKIFEMILFTTKILLQAHSFFLIFLTVYLQVKYIFVSTTTD